MKRMLPKFLVCLALATVLPGCVLSLFSDHEGTFVDDERLDRLEQRMDAIELRLPPAGPPPAAAPAPTPTTY